MAQPNHWLSWELAISIATRASHLIVLVFRLVLSCIHQVADGLSTVAVYFSLLLGLQLKRISSVFFFESFYPSQPLCNR